MSELMSAAVGRHERTVHILLENDADVFVKNNAGCMALRLAAENGNQHMIEILLEKDSDVNGKDEKDSTALIAAVKSKNERAVKLLLEKNADMNIVDTNGGTALAWERFHELKEVEQVLQEHGASEREPEIELASQERHSN